MQDVLGPNLLHETPDDNAAALTVIVFKFTANNQNANGAVAFMVHVFLKGMQVLSTPQKATEPVHQDAYSGNTETELC